MALGIGLLACGPDGPPPHGGAGGGGESGLAAGEGGAESGRGGSAGSAESGRGGNGGDAAAGAGVGGGAGESGASGQSGTPGSGGSAGSAGRGHGGGGAGKGHGGGGTAGQAGVEAVAGEAGAGGEGGSGGTGDCTGEPDSECPCLRVAPDGDDAAAAASLGRTPFANVAAAIDFAATHRDVAVNVCVAGGESCTSSASYAGPSAGDFAMSDGVSVYGSYESTSWTRCAETTTELLPATPVGILFDGSVASATTVSGFAIVPLVTEASAGVTVRAAREVTLDRLSIAGERASFQTIGVEVSDGADVALTGSVIELEITAAADQSPTAAFGVRSVGSSVRIADSSVSVATFGSPAAWGVWLEEAGGSTLADSDVLARSTYESDPTDIPTSFAALAITGSAAGVEISGNVIHASALTGKPTAIDLFDCQGDEPRIHDNPSIQAEGGYSTHGGAAPDVLATAIRSAGDCRPRIENNAAIFASGKYMTAGVGIHCTNQADSGVASQCTIRHNTVHAGEEMYQRQASGTGVLCEGGSCAEIVGNTIGGLRTTVPSVGSGCVRSCVFYATGLELLASAPLVDANTISQGCGFGAGISVSGASPRIQNNYVSARSCPGYGATAAIEGGGDLHSNSLVGAVGIPSDLEEFFPEDCTSRAVLGATSIRNNILDPGDCRDSVAIDQPGSLASISHNSFRTGSGPLVRTGLELLDTAEEVNAFSATGGNFTSGSVIDAGTAEGAPDHDYDGNPRSSTKPDVGPVEYGDVECPAESCSGHGRCEGAVADGGVFPQCSCDAGYVPSPTEPLTCVDCSLVEGGCGLPDPCKDVTCSGHGSCYVVGNTNPFCECDPGYFRPTEAATTCAVDACATNNGGCDPLTTCTRSVDGRTCGPCPFGYDGSGETGCVRRGPCEPNPCYLNAACYVVDDVAVCDCPPGILGETCGGSSVTGISLGAEHACGINPTYHQVACWGSNEAGQAAPPTSGFWKVSAGGRHTCGVRIVNNLEYGPVECWGANDFGQATPPSGDFAFVVAGGDHTCGSRESGAVECWGRNADGEATPPGGLLSYLVAGQHFTCAVPRGTGIVTCWGASESGQTTPPAITDWYRLSVGDRHGCITKSGSISCWGANDFGQAEPPSGGPFQFAACGGNHSCALANDGSLSCWGSNERGESSAPTGIFRELQVGATFACATTTRGNMTCWGDGRFGQTLLPGGSFVALTSAADHGCALRPGGSVVCWGDAEAGQGQAPASDFGAIAAGVGFTCGLHADGSLACFGAGLSEAPPAGLGFVTLGAGKGHACAVADDGSIECWGDDTFGQAEPPAGVFTTLALGVEHSCALDESGSALCWGANAEGQLDAPSGVFVALSAAADHTCGVRADATLACWGGGVTTPPPGSFVALGCGPSHDCAIATDGNVACWGADDFGEATPPAGQFLSVTTGLAGRTCGIRSDHSLVCWGGMAR